MKAVELISVLEDAVEEHGEDIEVRTMTPSWPFENDIAKALLNTDLDDSDPEIDTAGNEYARPHYVAADPDGSFKHSDPKRVVVFLVEGRQLGYGTKDAWEVW